MFIHEGHVAVRTDSYFEIVHIKNDNRFFYKIPYTLKYERENVMDE